MSVTVLLDREREVSRASRIQPPDLDLHLDVRFHTARMKIGLVCGVRPKDDWTGRIAVARDGNYTLMLEAARLYPFTAVGYAAAVLDMNGLWTRLQCDGYWITFTWRVLVEGPWERPEAVTPVWVVEGRDHPVQVRYYFL